MLIEKQPLPRTTAETATTFPRASAGSTLKLPTDPVARFEHHLEWFWFMYHPMAKWLARDDQERTAAQLAGLRGVICEAAALVGAAEPPARDHDDVFATVRQLAAEM